MINEKEFVMQMSAEISSFRQMIEELENKIFELEKSLKLRLEALKVKEKKMEFDR